MRGVVTRFFTFDALNVIPEVYYALLIIWVLLVFTTWHSILSRKTTITTKLLWLLVVTFIPIFGIASYCVYSLFVADYSYLKRLGLTGKG